jgi:hypothetical protein
MFRQISPPRTASPKRSQCARRSGECSCLGVEHGSDVTRPSTRGTGSNLAQTRKRHPGRSTKATVLGDTVQRDLGSYTATWPVREIRSYKRQIV